MDGMHRVCKALIRGLKTIKAVNLLAMPEPDFVGVPIDQISIRKSRRVERREEADECLSGRVL